MLEITPELQQRIEAHVGGGVFSQPSEVIPRGSRYHGRAAARVSPVGSCHWPVAAW